MASPLNVRPCKTARPATATFLPNAVAFGSGYITIGSMIKGRIWLNIIGIVLVTATTMTLAVWVFDIAF